jgi:hypothetical protein
MEFVNCLFVFYANEVVDDDDVKELNNGCHGNDFLSKGIFEIEEGLFNSLVEKGHLDPCTYGKDGDEELDLNVNGDVDKENHFKDLDPHELENVKVNEYQRNIHSKIWVINAFNAWQKYKKFNTSLLTMGLHF